MDRTHRKSSAKERRNDRRSNRDSHERRQRRRYFSIGQKARADPGVIHLTDIGGIRPSHREMAKRLAEKGYTVLMPNVFYRTTKPPVIDIKIGMGDPNARCSGSPSCARR